MNIYFIGFIILYLKNNLVQSEYYATEEKCSYVTRFCTCKISRLKQPILICLNFTSFTELVFTQCNMKFEKIIINPKKELELDDTLNFNGIMLNETSATVHLVNIKSFAYSPSPFKTIKFGGARKFSNLIITNSTLNFKYNNESFVKHCDSSSNKDSVDSLF